MTPAGRAAAEKYPWYRPGRQARVSMACSLVEPMASILSVAPKSCLRYAPVHPKVHCALHGNKHGQPVAFIICQPANIPVRQQLQLPVPRGARNPQQWFKTQDGPGDYRGCRTCCGRSRHPAWWHRRARQPCQGV